MNMTATEKEILEMLWRYPEGIRQSQLLEVFHAEGREWKRQTLNTFIVNMMEKGLVKREHRVVWPVCTQEEYNCRMMENALERMYQGKMANLFAAFAEADMVQEEDVEELLEVIEAYRKRNEKA